MPEMIEYFPEPEDREALAECVECGRDIYKGEKAVYAYDEYVCEECSRKTAFEDASKEDLIQYITEIDKKEDFIEWFYEPFVIVLGDEE